MIDDEKNDVEEVDGDEEATDELVVVLLQLLLGVPAVAIVCHLGESKFAGSSKVTSFPLGCSRNTEGVFVQALR